VKCHRCGEYDDTGAGKPYDGPAGRKYKNEQAASAFTTEESLPATRTSGAVGSELAQLAALHASGALSNEEFSVAKTLLLG